MILQLVELVVVVYVFGFLVTFSREAIRLSKEEGWTWAVVGKAALAGLIWPYTFILWIWPARKE